MTVSIRLPSADGGFHTRTLRQPAVRKRPHAPISSRLAYAAAHVVADPLGANSLGAGAVGNPASIDWDTTMAFRRHLWSYGLGVADAMDTAQRGMGLDWPTTQELVRRTGEEARACGGRLAVGAATDQADTPFATLDDIAAAYEEQIGVVEDAGATVVIMASRQLAGMASDADDYHHVYGRLLKQVSQPAILHWLGPVFDPALEGYWGSDDVDAAITTVLAVVHDHAERIDGIKVSLLESAHEVKLRRAVPETVRIYTGDDFNYPELIRGDGNHYSHALLGAFAVIAPAASEALQALDRGDLDAYDDALAVTLPLARHIFSAPTQYYKTGIAFMSWLCGYQPGFTMVGGLHSGRSVLHLSQILGLADDAQLLPDPELAAHRMNSFLEVAGVAP